MPAKMKTPTTKKNSNNSSTVTNPYRNSFGLSFRLKGSPVKLGQNGRINKVFTTATLADGVFVSWTVGPDGKGTSYLKQHIEFFNENNDAMNLMELWAGCIGFVKRRIYDPENPKDDTLMPGKPGVSWGYDAVVNVALSDEDTPSSIGKKIAEQFEKFTEQPGYTGSKQVYKFGGDLTPSDTELQPLSHLLRNDDIVNLFLFLFGDKGKDELFKNEPLLVSFFGDADTAREILSYHAFV